MHPYSHRRARSAERWIHKAVLGLCATLRAAADLRAHEIRTGITVIDAVAADDLNTQLLVGTGSPLVAHEVRVMALELVKNGVTTDEVGSLIDLHWLRISPGRQAFLAHKLRQVAAARFITSPGQIETLLRAADVISTFHPENQENP